jgi:hypothetical protein
MASTKMRLINWNYLSTLYRNRSFLLYIFKQQRMWVINMKEQLLICEWIFYRQVRYFQRIEEINLQLNLIND